MTAIPLAVIMFSMRTKKLPMDAGTLTRTTDNKARVSLPKDFANATVIIEQITDSEVRIRKARVIPEEDLHYLEESRTPLSDKDRGLFLARLDNPPRPNQALRRLLKKAKSGHG